MINNFFCKVAGISDNSTGLSSIEDNISSIASKFVDFFNLSYPLEMDHLTSLCFSSGIEINFLPDGPETRGLSCSHGEDIIIFIKENDAPCSQIHTILHELCEIFIKKILNKKYIETSENKYLLERIADQFSAEVHVPGDEVLNRINGYGFDVFLLQKSLNCSYATALIRFHDVLYHYVKEETKKPIPLISLLYHRPYWEERPNGRIPRLKFRCLGKSKGFKFRMGKKEVNNIIIYDDIDKCFMRQIIKAKEDMFFQNVMMEFKDKHLEIDMLIRLVYWKEDEYPSKVLIHIIPSEHLDMTELAGRKNVPHYNLSIFRGVR
ncbi:conserved hypothetical protein [Candidatus Desulfarcum epimagneticum]|uniref:IrrE N-terminal-like domain-containing protein n=1 Tax=uncultured Desulfobacteraceae bacterium TaxID=218296 RepID=A0A484HN47_9BACT|nr:conserved hypothetical protein [uncultured Desulfobacteraceae bacterium]